jgi:pyruvate/2-oxoglutarate dehydrogenase complex dihydrolipoamide acyltransferase (E2) component
MPREIYLVKVGMSMTEGMVSEWFIPDGAQVKKGELVYALETEKVNLDVDSDYDGTVKHLVEVGVTIEPGDVVGYIFEAGEDIPDTLPGAPAAAAEAVSEPEPAAPVPAAAPQPTPQPVVSAPVAVSAPATSGDGFV